MGEVNIPQTPNCGWIKAIRQALGMSHTQLAGRLGVTRQTVSELESNEVSGKITVTSFKKVAQALNCDAKVVFVSKRRSEVEK